jgi:hypothetical protein
MENGGFETRLSSTSYQVETEVDAGYSVRSNRRRDGRDEDGEGGGDETTTERRAGRVHSGN